MQNNYVGDVGDFVKYGLLNFIAGKNNLILGINWYFCLATKRKNKSDGKRSRDGKYTDYLKPNNRWASGLQACSPTLYHQMHEIVLEKKYRNIKGIEEGSVLPKRTIFYGELLRNDRIPSQQKASIRNSWHLAALNALKRADIVFLDPDNGIETPKMSSFHRISSKHVSFEEISDYYNKRGQSVIIYNHKSHQEESIYQQRFRKLRGLTATIYILRAHRGTARDFVFLLQPKHKKLMENAISGFMKSGWKEHFNRVKY